MAASIPKLDDLPAILTDLLAVLTDDDADPLRHVEAIATVLALAGALWEAPPPDIAARFLPN